MQQTFRDTFCIRFEKIYPLIFNFLNLNHEKIYSLSWNRCPCLRTERL